MRPESREFSDALDADGVGGVGTREPEAVSRAVSARAA
jgi:hypothetical protein